ncbi:MAG TPA: hypothetical protein VK419_17375 [Bryobacteraceae bacterium]|nr:hypothetical protein [Bryobacteraceae bacterium]
MKTKLIATLLLAGSTMFAAPRISVGVGFGFPVPVASAPVVVAPPVVAAVPPCPGPDYAGVGGYYAYVGGRPVWHAGYWDHRAFAPRYEVRHFRR